ncbi:Aste57867_15091 [Aphanomyces stellatus]|uniref:Aste57867_15091 protein n=1 Tax=Aphanomyces stellatus TaxID=120398 RepID=A0A485L514_9STRA|nr:hypothetical protein As57867_015035 [Aphanomyces stellatus]VFT91904.1 Aste57867_15091 [Aphanomyces stellatus]
MGQLFIGVNRTFCFESDLKTRNLAAAVCDKTKPNQVWTWSRSTKLLNNTKTGNYLLADLRGNQMVSLSFASQCSGFWPPMAAGNAFQYKNCDPEDDLQVFTFGNV